MAPQLPAPPVLLAVLATAVPCAAEAERWPDERRAEIAYCAGAEIEQ